VRVGKAQRSRLAVAIISDQPALLQQPHTIVRYRNALRGFASADQPPAYLGVIDRRIHAIGRLVQVERGAINVPWLRSVPREFVDLGYDCKDQGRNTVARLFWHSLTKHLRSPRKFAEAHAQCTVSGG
jgi:hypothetical protein